MSLFDPKSLLQQPLPDANDTKRTLLPVGEPIGLCDEVNIVDGIAKESGKPWFKLNARYVIADREYLANVGDGKLDNVKITYGIMLELTESNTIATGTNKNVKLGAWREAHGINMLGKQFADAVGRPARLRITHRPDPEKKDENGKSVIYDEVSAVMKGV